MPRTNPDSPTQLGRTIVIDARQYKAVGDGIADDTTALQNALNTAGSASLVLNVGADPSIVVELPIGKFRTTTALKFPHDGIILRGVGMMGQGNLQNPGVSDNLCSILYAGTGFQHDATPMVRISPGDGPAFQQWYRGTCIQNVAFDVSASSRWSTGAPPPVLQLKGCSNCPEFREIVVFGGIGTAFEIGPYNITPTVDAISENLRFINCWAYCGYGPTGSVNTMPTSPGIKVIGGDNIQFLGGLLAYNYGSLFTTGSTAGPQVLNTLSDVPGIQVIPSITTGGNLGTLGSVIFENFFVTNYVVACRLSNVLVSGTIYCVSYCVFRRFHVENYNKVFQVNQEITGTTTFWRTRMFIEACQMTGSYAGYGGNAVAYPPYAATAFKLTAGNLVGGRLQIDFLEKTGDVSLDSTCTGVEYDIGTNPNNFAFFSASDAGGNCGSYSKNGLPGRIFNGDTRCMGSSDPATSTSTPAGNRALSCWGDTVKLWDVSRNVGPHFNSVAGQFGDIALFFNGSNWVLAICVISGNAGVANWAKLDMTGVW